MLPSMKSLWGSVVAMVAVAACSSDPAGPGADGSVNDGAASTDAPATLDATVPMDGAAPADVTPDVTPDAPPDVPPVPVSAVTESGPVNGVSVGGVAVFRRIPYAAPPVGARRFTPPAPPTPWTTPIDGTVAGSQCASGSSVFEGSMVHGDEDCLHVNVFTRSTAGSRPVMVWIHGGGFTTGSGSDPVYDGTRFVVEDDVVVVTINYRLGVFGFLAHPSVAMADGTTGNWGFLDQQAALRWVRANAAHFGGDPSRVTIFGESAGATSVLLHTVAPGSRGLFVRAIAESSPVLRIPSRERSTQFGNMVAASAHCTTGDVAACLRAASATDLYAGVPAGTDPGGPFFQDRGVVYLPTLDGVTFTEQPLVTLRAGHEAAVPVILGTNSDEGTLFAGGLLGAAVATDADYHAALGRGATLLGLTSAQGDAIYAQYPVSRYGTPARALTAVTTEGIFHCANRWVARAHTAAGNAAFLYRFDQLPAHVTLPGIGVFHAAELSFVWGVRNGLLGDDSSAPALGPAMRAYWSSFAGTGVPSGTPAWAAYDATRDQRLQLATPIASEPVDPNGRCGFWSGLFDTLN